MRPLAALLLVVFFGSLGLSLAQAIEAGDWTANFGHGYFEYQNRGDGGSMTVGCDIAFSLDGSGSGLSFQLGGSMPPPSSELVISIDGKETVVPAGTAGGLDFSDCPECVSLFSQIVSDMATGSELAVTASDGRTARFNLAGLASLMTAPCPTPEGDVEVAAPAPEASDAPEPEATVPDATEPADGQWALHTDPARGVASARGMAEDGVTAIKLGCSSGSGKAVQGSISGYRGDRLARVEDDPQTVVFEFTIGDGSPLRYDGPVGFVAADDTWTVSGFPVDMLEAFARGSRMAIVDADGGEIAHFGLKGTAKARRAMRDVCGF